MTRTPAANILEDVHWLIDSNMHPELITQELGRSADSIAIAARRAGDTELARIFRTVAGRKREIKRAS